MQDRAAAVSGDGRGDREDPVPEPFGFPAPCFVFGVGEEPSPGGDLGREGNDCCPDLVLIEPVQREVAEPSVFRVSDPVLAAGPAAVAELEPMQLASAGVVGERGEPVTVDVIETALRARVRAFPPDDDPHPVGPSGQIEQPGQLGMLKLWLTPGLL